MNSSLISVKKEANGIKTFKFKKPKGYNFIPGQHCQISLDNESRPFTLINTPNDEYLEFLIKKEGKLTSKLFDLEINSEVKIGEPFGTLFNYKENKDELVFIAGGSGVTPFLSLLRHIVKNKKENKVTLFYFNKTEEDIPCKEDFEKLNEMENISIKLILTKPDETWEGETGYFRKELIENMSRDSDFYLCGPSRLINESIIILNKNGVSNENIKYEKWSTPKENKMDKNKLYKCQICGNTIQVVDGKPVPVMCCGQEMTKMEEHTLEEENQEKHVPIIKVNGNEVSVKVGSIEHPMTEDHYIQLIQLLQGNKLVGEKELQPDEKPEAKFYLENTENLEAKDLCNLHGLWKS